MKLDQKHIDFFESLQTNSYFPKNSLTYLWFYTNKLLLVKDVIYPPNSALAQAGFTKELVKVSVSLKGRWVIFRNNK